MGVNRITCSELSKDMCHELSEDLCDDHTQGNNRCPETVQAAHSPPSSWQFNLNNCSQPVGGGLGTGAQFNECGEETHDPSS